MADPARFSGRKKFEKIYNETYKEVALYVVTHVKNCQDVEDILKTIYMHVFKEVKKKQEINKPYLFGIVKHKVKDYYRFRYKDKIVSFFEKKEMEVCETSFKKFWPKLFFAGICMKSLFSSIKSIDILLL